MLNNFISTIIICFLLFMATSSFTLAQNNNKGSSFGNFEVGIPGVDDPSIDAFARRETPILDLLNIIINLVTVVIVIIGLITIVVSGYVYMTAGGIAERVSLAKVLIGSALTGIIIAFAAWLILNTLSPQFANDAKEPCLSTPANPCPPAN